MTNLRFLPSAGLLLAIAACAPDIATTVPFPLESLTTLGEWMSEETDTLLPDPDDD